jgi:hypothetical protein
LAALLIVQLNKSTYMKKLAIVSLCLLAIVLMQCNSGKTESSIVSNNLTTVKVTETKTTYTLEASFPRDKAHDFYNYINASIAPAAQFNFEDGDLETNTSLDDGTKFHIKSQRGELEFTFDKTTNTHESYRRMKSIYEGLKGIVI